MVLGTHLSMEITADFATKQLLVEPLIVTTDHVFPPYRTLQFDFVSTKHAPVGTQPMKSTAFKNFWLQLVSKDEVVLSGQ